MKMVFGILIIVGAVILIATLAPPYFSNYEFQDALKTESQMSTYTTKTEDVIRDEVFRKAQDMDIPITREQIKVVRNGVVGTGTVDIEANYLVHVNLPGYPMDLHFDASARSKGVFSSGGRRGTAVLIRAPRREPGTQLLLLQYSCFPIRSLPTIQEYMSRNVPIGGGGQGPLLPGRQRKCKTRLTAVCNLGKSTEDV